MTRGNPTRVGTLLRRALVTGRDRGSASLEQIAITVGLLALAIGVVAGVGAAVAHYMGKL